MNGRFESKVQQPVYGEYSHFIRDKYLSTIGVLRRQCEHLIATGVLFGSSWRTLNSHTTRTTRDNDSELSKAPTTVTTPSSIAARSAVSSHKPAKNTRSVATRKGVISRQPVHDPVTRRRFIWVDEDIEGEAVVAVRQKTWARLKSEQQRGTSGMVRRTLARPIFDLVGTASSGRELDEVGNMDQHRHSVGFAKQHLNVRGRVQSAAKRNFVAVGFEKFDDFEG